MILSLNLIGFYTIVISMMGMYSTSVPRWLALISLALGGLSMLSAFSRARARPWEPFGVALGMAIVGVVALLLHSRAWYPVCAFLSAAFHLAAIGEYTHRVHKTEPHAEVIPSPRGFFARRGHARIR